MSDHFTSPTRTRRLHDWVLALRVYLEPASWRMLLLGFSAGLPMVLVLGTLGFRLTEAGVSATTVGYFSWTGLAHGFKWAWAPLVDRLPLPWLTVILGRRRSWLLIAQLAVAAGLAAMALYDPRIEVQAIAVCAVVVAFGSATQDLTLDAYRIELAGAAKQAALAAVYQTGYRLGMIWAGAGALWIAAWAEIPGAAAYQHAAWRISFLVMAASMLLGMATVLLSSEPARRQLPQARSLSQWFASAVVEPFSDFIRRYGWQAALILVLIGVYRISDVVMGVMAYPFYAKMNFTKEEVAAISKVYGVVMTLLGGFIGGAMSLRLGVMRVLMLGALLSAASNLLFAWLGTRGHDVGALVFVISADNLSSGIASAAFIAYLSSLTNVNYSATQYALFSSIMLLLPKWLAGFSGRYVDAFGYSHFFVATACLGAPVLLLVWLASKAKMAPSAPAASVLSS